MSANVLLNLLNELRICDKCEACIYHFFAMSLIKKYRSTNVRFCLSYDFKIFLLTRFGRDKRLDFAINTQRCYGHHFIIIHVPENLFNTSGLSILMHGVYSLPDATSL